MQQQDDEDYLVTLNVGGTIFCTTRATLVQQKDTFFDKMLNSKGLTPILKDTHGNIFIDRNPQWFGRVLDFLRDGTFVQNISQQDCQAVLREAQYYNIIAMVDVLEKHMQPPAIVAPDSIPCKYLLLRVLNLGQIWDVFCADVEEYVTYLLVTTIRLQSLQKKFATKLQLQPTLLTGQLQISLNDPKNLTAMPFLFSQRVACMCYVYFYTILVICECGWKLVTHNDFATQNVYASFSK